MIAHQFVGMERFDRILVLKEGAVIEQGAQTAQNILRTAGIERR